MLTRSTGAPKAQGASTCATDQIPADLAQRIATAQVLRYAGYIYDETSGLYYCSQRYYDHLTQAFISLDPAQADGQRSGYLYCAGDPVNNVDSSGLSSNLVFKPIPHYTNRYKSYHRSTFSSGRSGIFTYKTSFTHVSIYFLWADRYANQSVSIRITGRLADQDSNLTFGAYYEKRRSSVQHLMHGIPIRNKRSIFIGAKFTATLYKHYGKIAKVTIVANLSVHDTDEAIGSGPPGMRGVRTCYNPF